MLSYFILSDEMLEMEMEGPVVLLVMVDIIHMDLVVDVVITMAFQVMLMAVHQEIFTELV